MKRLEKRDQKKEQPIEKDSTSETTKGEPKPEPKDKQSNPRASADLSAEVAKQSPPTASSSEQDGKIIISRIEDIPTRPDLPRFVNIEALDQSSPSQAAANIVESQTKKETSGYTRLKFELNIPARRGANLPAKPTSTFAELSNRLGPTVSLNRKPSVVPNLKQQLAEKKEVQKKEIVVEKKEIVKPEEPEVVNIVEDAADTDEVVFLKSSRSRSRSFSRSRSRSRSWSYTSYSRSRSRSYSYSSYSRYSYSSYSRSR